MRLRHLLCCVCLASAVLAFASPANAQRLEDGQVSFEGSPAYRNSRTLRNQLGKGEVTADPKDKAHLEAIDVMARDYVYPLYWVGERSFAPGKVNGVVDNFAGRLGYLSRDKVKERTATLQQMLCKASIPLCQEVITKGKPIVAVNGAMMLWRIVERRVERGALQSEKDWAEDVLPRLADGNGDLLATTCLTLLEDNKTKDGTRYYLFRALSSLLAVPAKTPVVKKENEEKAILAALKFLEKKPAFAKNAPREELEGYKALRREAVKVVAQARTAVVGEKGQAALALARVAAGDERLALPPRVDERVEAAVGLARLMAQGNKAGVQADYAAMCIAHAVEAFGLAANENIEKTGLERARAWKIDAARLGEAVDAMKGDGKDKYVADVAKQATAVLTPIQGGSKSPANSLGEWLKENAAASKSLIKGDDEATVKPVKQAAEEK